MLHICVGVGVNDFYAYECGEGAMDICSNNVILQLLYSEYFTEVQF